MTPEQLTIDVCTDMGSKAPTDGRKGFYGSFPTCWVDFDARGPDKGTIKVMGNGALLRKIAKLIKEERGL